MSQPIIVYIDDNDDGFFSGRNENPERDGLSYFLRENCQCDVINYDDQRDFENNLLTLKRYFYFQQLILIIIKQEKYCSQHLDLINLIRQELSTNLPIVVIPNFHNDKVFSGSDDALIYALFPEDKKLVELINDLKINWQEPNDWLGADTKKDQSLLMKNLENAYRQHYFDDTMLGVPDYNHMVVAEALRLKSLPSSYLKAEFEDTICNFSFFNLKPESSIYHQEIKKIRTMNDDEKRNLIIQIMAIRGYRSHENGWIVERATCGHQVNGFAIDPITLETLITTRPGMHHKAGYLLSRRIKVIEGIKNQESYYDGAEHNTLERRLITGLIYLIVPGFKTPILQLNEHGANPVNLQKIMPLLKRQQNFIILDCDGFLLN
jgi:hypothetical protein